MTYQTAIEAGLSMADLEATLLIDGVPLLFGSNSSLVLNTSSIFINGPASLTSINALVKDTIKPEGSELDYDQMVVGPSGMSVSIRSTPTIDRFFERRRTPRTRLTAPVTNLATTLNVQNTSGFGAGGVAYVDRECILVGGTGTNTLTTVTRAYAALPNQSLQAHQDGAFVQGSPTHLRGRMAELRFHVGDQVRLVGRYVLDSYSHNGVNNTWDLRFADAMHMILERPLATGMDGIRVQAIGVTASSDTPSQPLLKLTLAGDWQWLPTTLTGGLRVVITLGEDVNDGKPIITPVVSINGTGDLFIKHDAITAWLGDAVSGGVTGTTDPTGPLGRDFSVDGISCRLCYVLNGPPMRDLLRVLLSDRGNGDNNATYDVLFGTSTSGSTSTTVSDGALDRRFGAGIRAALLDLTTLANDDVLAEQGIGWSYVLDSTKQAKVIDLLTEVGIQLGGFFFLNGAGQLSFKRLSGLYASPVVVARIPQSHVDINESHVSVDDESLAVHSIIIECNCDPLTDKLMGKVTIRDMRMYETFRDSASAVTWKLKGLVVDVPQQNGGQSAVTTGSMPAIYEELVARFDKIVHRRMVGVPVYTLTLPFRYHTLLPGDVIAVTCEALRTFAGGTLNNTPLEVVSVSGIDLEYGTVTITAHGTWAAKPVSPSSVVQSWAGGPPQVITLVTNHRYGGGASPGDYWPVGWKLRLLDRSADPPFSLASGVLTVTAKTATTVTVTGTVGFTPVNGDILVQSQYDDANSTAQNTAGFAQRDYAFQADTGGRLGTANNNADTWG